MRREAKVDRISEKAVAFDIVHGVVFDVSEVLLGDDS